MRAAGQTAHQLQRGFVQLKVCDIPYPAGHASPAAFAVRGNCSTRTTQRDRRRRAVLPTLWPAVSRYPADILRAQHYKAAPSLMGRQELAAMSVAALQRMGILSTDAGSYEVLMPSSLTAPQTEFDNILQQSCSRAVTRAAHGCCTSCPFLPWYALALRCKAPRPPAIRFAVDARHKLGYAVLSIACIIRVIGIITASWRSKFLSAMRQ